MFRISHHSANINNLHSQTENELTDQEISIEAKNWRTRRQQNNNKEIGLMWAIRLQLCSSLRVLFQWNCCWPTIHLLTQFHFKKLCTTFAVNNALCALCTLLACFLLLPFCFTCLFSWLNLFNYMAFWFFILSFRCFRFFVRKMRKMILNQQHTKISYIRIVWPIRWGALNWIASSHKRNKRENIFFFILLRNELNHLFYWMQSMLTLFGVIPTNR